MTKKPETVKAGVLIEKNGIWFKKYSRKPFTGCAEDYHDNGQLLNKQKFINGNRHGLYEWFDKNGKLIEE